MAPPPTCDCGNCAKCKHRARMAKWYRKPGVADRVRASVRRYQKENAEKVRAKDRVRARRSNAEKQFAHNAARKLGKGQHPCEQCGAEDLRGSDGRTLIQAHHPDYSKPLEVHWLCATCHGIEHRIIP